MKITRRSFTALAAGLPAMAPRIAHAQGAPQVIIATYAGLGTESWKKIVTDPFTKATGITATVFETPLPSASLAQAQGKPQFNLALTAAYSGPALLRRDLIETLTIDDVPNMANVPRKLWPVTPDGKLVGVPVYFGLFGIAYNTSLAKASDFSSWKSLLDPKWKGQLSITRANFLAGYDVQLYAKLNGGNEKNLQPGYDFLRRLIPQALNVYSSMASLEAQLARGEITAAPFYANEVALMRRNGNTEVAIRIPDEGGLILPYMLVLPKGAPNPAAAKRMLNAVLEQPYQAGFSETSLVWPMNASTRLPDGLVKEMGGSVDDAIAKNIDLDWWTVGTNLEAETRKVDTMLQEVR